MNFPFLNVCQHEFANITACPRTQPFISPFLHLLIKRQKSPDLEIGGVVQAYVMFTFAKSEPCISLNSMLIINVLLS